MRRKKLAYLAALIVLLALSLASCGGAGDSDEEVAIDPNAIAPEPYRDQILAVEALLYKKSPPEPGDYERVAEAVLQLHKKISEADISGPALKRVNRLLYLAARADLGGTGYTLPDLKPFREDWEKVRGEVFIPADWFFSGGPEIGGAQTHLVPKADAQDVFALTRVIERLQDLIEEGRADAEELGEPEYDAEHVGFKGLRQIAEWHRWSTEWEGQISDIVGRLPEAAAWDGEPNYLLAYQDVERAIQELRFVPQGAGIWSTPFRYQWEARFSAAESSIQNAQSYLAQTNQ